MSGNANRLKLPGGAEGDGEVVDGGTGGGGSRSGGGLVVGGAPPGAQYDAVCKAAQVRTCARVGAPFARDRELLARRIGVGGEEGFREFDLKGEAPMEGGMELAIGGDEGGGGEAVGEFG